MAAVIVAATTAPILSSLLINHRVNFNDDKLAFLDSLKCFLLLLLPNGRLSSLSLSSHPGDFLRAFVVVPIAFLLMRGEVVFVCVRDLVSMRFGSPFIFSFFFGIDVASVRV